MDTTTLLIVGAGGAIAGLIIGINGYIKSEADNLNPAKSFADKVLQIISAKNFDIKKFLITVVTATFLGAVFAVGIEMNIIPQEAILVLAPYSMREFFSDWLKVKDGITKKIEDAKPPDAPTPLVAKLEPVKA